MTTIYFKSDKEDTREVSLKDNESVLNALLRIGVEVPYGCRSGVCQSCIMKTEHCEIPKNAQKGLREVQKQQGYFLSCCCVPTESFSVSLSDQYKKELTSVIDKTFLTPDIIRLRVKKVICYRPGQYMTLWKDQEIARSYSLASHPTKDDFIEFHIRVYPGGSFSSWVANQLNVGDQLQIQGPMGDCFYSIKDKSQTLFLSGIGTGLAPLYGIVRDALLYGHKGKILLLIGSRSESNLYYSKELSALKSHYPQLEVRYSIQNIAPELVSTHSRESDIYATAKMLMPSLADTSVFLCGNDSFVKKMRKQCFLSGANMGDIYSDSFLNFPQKSA